MKYFDSSTAAHPTLISPVVPRTPIRTTRRSIDSVLLLFLAAHIVLGVLIFANRQLTIFHQLGTLGIGLFWALTQKGNSRFAYLAAYIVGSEVLWRMSSVSIFWEFGKYAVTLVLGIGFLRIRSRIFPVLPLFYLLLLLPAALITLQELDLIKAREQISFNLAGHLAFVMGAFYFSQIKLTKLELHKLLLALAAPVISIATLLLINLVLNINEIRWINDSNFQTSGGFGPNQISSTLGLGAVVLWLILTSGSFKVPTRIVLLVFCMWLISQSMLTFSRGGLYNAVAALGGVFLYLLVTRQQSVKSTFYLLIAVLAFVLIFFPQLDELTQGSLGLRFTDTGTTNRAELVDISLSVFMEFPLTGVGVGMAKQYGVDELGVPFAAHTEYARVLSEHGILGAIALILLVIMALKNFFRARSNTLLATIVIAALVWAFVYMTNAAMRTAAPSFMLALSFVGFAEFSDDADEADDVPQERSAVGATE